MKSRNILIITMLLLAISSLVVISCKKDEKEKGSNDYSSMSNLSKDELTVEDATDESMKDVEAILADNGNNKSTLNIPCNATVDSTEVINDTITIYITYDGLSCDGKRLRTGQVEIRKHQNTHFGMPGASVNVRHINFTITRVATGQSVTFNSNKTFTNVTGGFVFMLGNNGFDSLVHRIRGVIDVTFDNGTTRNWHIARQVTFAGSAGNFTLSCAGFGVEAPYTDLTTWGINRNGELFYSQILQPIVLKQSCEWDPCSGIKVHQIPAVGKSATVTFGFNSSYQPITGDECPTHYKVDWINGDYTGSAFMPLR